MMTDADATTATRTTTGPTTAAPTARHRFLAGAKRLGAITAIAGSLALGASAVAPAQPTSAHGGTLLWSVSSTEANLGYWGYQCRSRGGHIHVVSSYWYNSYYGFIYNLQCRR
jgi:hypothetical protein